MKTPIEMLKAIIEMQEANYGNGMNTHMALHSLCEEAREVVKNCNAPAVSKCEGLQRKLQLAITGLSIISKNGDGASSEYASELINDIDNCC